MAEDIKGSGFQGSPGPATDRHNEAVVDPTANVLDLVEAAVKRIDDLRESEIRRLDALREAGERHFTEMTRTRSHFENQLRLAETQRIDAIRAVDVAAVIQQASAAETRATALAAQVAASAEAMRNQVQAAAQAAATALAAALEPIIKDIADLRRAQYEAQGQKTQVVETRAIGASTGMWVGVGLTALAFAVAVVGLVIGLQ
jgi:hypothetical protein